MKLLYCYILFLDENGEKRAYRGMEHVELNLSATDKFTYNVTNNSFQREDRKAPLPDHFWTDDNTASEYRNLYNVNVIAGQNGSGKTTAMRCVMNLLDNLHEAAVAVVDGSKGQDDPKQTFRHRALLLLEEGGDYYMLDWAPPSWRGEAPQMKDFPEGQLHMLTGRGSFLPVLQQDGAGKTVAELLRKTKAIYLSNTLTQYDVEHCAVGENEHLRDFFLYDASLGASIGRDIAQFFPYEIFKEVRYVFDPAQEALRKELQAQTEHEIILPHTLRLGLRLDQYRKSFSHEIFPSIAVARAPIKKLNVSIRPGNVDLPSLLGRLCVAAFAENLERLANRQALSLLRDWPIEKNDHAILSRLELNKQISPL